jgi:uncharacterized protein
VGENALKYLERVQLRCRTGFGRTASAVYAAALIAFAPLQAGAADSPVSDSIEVTAQAHAEAAPDLALLDFGVVTQAPSAGAAARDNAERMEAVLSAVRKTAGAEARINTGRYAIRAIYASARDGGTQRITGYEVSNIVHLRTKALANLGVVIDAATAAGANQVQRLVFTLADDSAAAREALRKAVLKARAEAETIAAALGLKLGAVHSVVKQELGVVQPLVRQAAAMSFESSPVTPVEPGSVEVRARVVLRITIAR